MYSNEDLVRDFMAGMTSVEIAKKSGLKTHNVDRRISYLRKRGVRLPARRRGPVPRNKCNPEVLNALIDMLGGESNGES